MDKELNALRRVAKAARNYQELVSQKESLQLNLVNKGNHSVGVMELSSVEFELAEALNAWYRTQYKAAQ